MGLNAVSILVVITSLFCITDALAVMSVDLGSDWIKIGIVSPGVPMEIVLNKESKRKTPTAVSFRNGEREFGESAVNTGIRFPESSYRYFLDLLGKKIDNPIVTLYKRRFPYCNIVGDAERESVVFKHDEETSFNPEELLAMILSKSRELAEEFAGQTVKDMVVTVPAFFNQAERRAVLNAAELAGVKILQLMSDNAAVALNYGIFRIKDFNTTMQRIMFYDMGASSTKATIVGYQVVKSKEKGSKESHPQLSILGIGYDRTLGGLEISLRLRDYFAKKFNEMKLTPNDITDSPRAMAKLLKEAERVKMVLSANADHVAQVEGLLDEKDFKLPISRVDLEEMCADLFERVKLPVEMALKDAAMAIGDIDQVILVGAGTRVPRVQDSLLQVVKTELGKNLNTDEAAAMGAAYQAAHLSQGFKVKRFIVKEAVIFPIHVTFEREMEPEEGEGVKKVTRTLFGPLNPYPQKKVMTFNRHVRDFMLNINYGELKFLTPLEQEAFGSFNISTVSIKGVSKAIDKHIDDGSEAKGVKAHFKMDESGILSLDHVESVFEKKVEVEAEESESTLSKLRSSISKLFSGGQGEGGTEATADASDNTKEQDGENIENMQTTQNGSETNADFNSTDSNATHVPDEKTEDGSKNVTKQVETKLTQFKETITYKWSWFDLPEISNSFIKNSKEKLHAFHRKEQEKRDREEARNSLESFIIDTQDKLYQDEFEAAITEMERSTFQAQLSEVSEWLDEDGGDTQTKMYREKLSSLKSLTQGAFERVQEHRDRPEAVSALHHMVNMSEVFVAKARNMSEDEQYFTEVEVAALEKLIVETKEWLKDKEEIQAKTPLTESPILTIRSIAEKIAGLDREVKYLINKARVTKPKPKKSEKGVKDGNSTTLPDTETLDTPGTDSVRSDEADSTKQEQKESDFETEGVSEEEPLESQESEQNEASTSKPSLGKDHAEL